MPKTKHTLQDRLLAAEVAIDNSLSDSEIRSFLAEFGYDEERIKQGKALYDKASVMYKKQKADYGDQFAATDKLQEIRDKAKDSLEDWLSDFIAIARVALEERPQLLEKLGILEPS